MNDTVDHLSQHDARLIPEVGGTRLFVDSSEVIFEGRASDELRHVVNRAVRFVLAYFQRNLDRANAPRNLITDYQVEQVAIKVALHYLYMYNMWKNHDEEYRDHDLNLTTDDLTHPYTRDQVLFFCEEQFPTTYQSMAALLLDESPEEFIKWERSRRDFWSHR